MHNFLDKEYIHIGTDKLYKELWLNVQTDQIYKSYIKPYGGLWTSNKNSYSICDWIDYKEDNCSNEELEAFYSLDSLLIKFKSNSKLLIIDNINDYNNLKNSNLITILDKPILINKWYYNEYVNEVLNYEKINQFYDLIYINPQAHKSLSNYSINTMYALNPNCIEYYKSLKIDYNNKKVLNIGNKLYIEEPNNEYYKLVEYIKPYFDNIVSDNYEEYILKLYKLQKQLISEFINKDNIPYINNTSLNKKKVLEIVIRNIYREKYLQKKLEYK